MPGQGIQFKTAEEYAQELRERPSDKPHQPEPHKPEPHKPEPTHPEEPQKPMEEPPRQSVAPVSFSVSEFQQIIATVIAEARKPVRDERMLARLQRMKEHNRAMQKDNRDMLYNRFLNCNHMQLPGSVMTGCSCIAWAIQSDQKKRGTCQHCGTVFSSERSECLNDEVWEAYRLLVRLPTHPAGNINHIFQSA